MPSVVVKQRTSRVPVLKARQMTRVAAGPEVRRLVRKVESADRGETIDTAGWTDDQHLEFLKSRQG